MTQRASGTVHREARTEVRASIARVRAALFDFDGTLVHQRIDFGLMRRRVLAVLCAHGVVTEQVAERHVLEMIARAHGELARGDPRLAERMQAAAYAAIEEIELLAAPEAAPCEGAVELLSALRRAGIGVGIVTRNCRAAVERVLQVHDMEHDVLLTRDHVPHVKPDPRHLQQALAALGVAGERAMMCGDHPMDVVAGHRVGALTVAVLPEGRSTGYFADVAPDLVVASVGDLLPLMGISED